MMHVSYAECMTTIQIRNVPESVSRALKARAAAEGRSLSDYLLREVTTLAQLPTLAEMAERLAALPPPPSSMPPAAAMIRQAREEAGRA